MNIKQTTTIFFALLMAICSCGQPSKKPVFNTTNPSMHDPVMAFEDSTYYIFSTGMGISVMSSRDLKTWKLEKPVFDKAPEWAVKAIPGFKGHIWAPDIIFHNGLYHLFYSCSAFGKNTSAIGHASTPILNPNSSDFHWTDHGMILQSVPKRDDWNAIDPNIIIDKDGTPWMNFGSFWDGIKMVRLSDDLQSIAQPEEWHTLSRRKMSPPAQHAGASADNPVEAPFIFRHGNYFYLLVSFDYCCQGLKSSYKIAVGRSESAVGPFYDKEGRPMTNGGGTIIAEGNEKWAGLGHCAAYTFNEQDYLICHGYSIEEEGASKLIIRPIKWDAQEWPVIDL